MENTKFKFKVHISYLCGNDDKDWEEIEIVAENDKNAKIYARNHRRHVYKIEILSKETYETEKV
jgi:hypothetical protein